MISASLSPNTERDDVLLALKTLFTPWKWQKGEALLGVRRWFDNKITLFSSGRVAFYAILKSFDIGAGDEVIIQAFTCVAVPNSILWVGAKPVYADIDNTYNLDPANVKKKITKKTKAIIVQHTFGIQADLAKISKIAKKYNLFLIEDFAHSLGLPTRGDAAFFSFGRDKVVSSVWGGGAIINGKWQMANGKLRQFERNLPHPNNFWIVQQLLHPIAFSTILLLYDVMIGKIILVLLQKLHLLSIPVYNEEKHGGRPHELFVKFPNALAILALNQLRKLDRFTRERREIARYYSKYLSLPFYENSIYLRFPIEVASRPNVRGVLLGNWYHNIIDPTGVNLERIGYTLGSCPNAERAARHIINLPTRITVTQAKYVASQIKR